MSTADNVQLIEKKYTSTGGSDQLALIIHKRLPSLSTGTIMTIFDGVVVLFDWTLGGSLLFSVIAVLLCNGAIDLTDTLFNRKAAPDWLNKSINWYKRMSPQLRYAMGISQLSVRSPL